MTTFRLFQLFLITSAVPIQSDDGRVKSLLRRKRTNALKKMNINDDLEDFGKLMGDWFRVNQDSSFPELSSCKYDLNLDCCLADGSHTTCNSYMDMLLKDYTLSCDAEVEMKYIFTNIAETADTLQDIEICLNNGVCASIIDDIPQENLTLDPRETLIHKKTTTLNFCQQKSGIEASSNLKCTDGDIETTFTKYNLYDRPIELSCNAGLDISCQTASGGKCLPKVSQNSCYFRPFYIDLQLNGNLCFESHHDQGEKFACIDDSDLPNTDDLPQMVNVFIEVLGMKNTEMYYSGYVQMNDTFTIGTGAKLDSDIKVMLYDHQGGNPLQTIRFHASCSVPISIGDIFGAITIVGMRDDINSLSIDMIDYPDTFLFNATISNPERTPIVIKNMYFDIPNSGHISIPLLENTQVPSQGVFAASTTTNHSITSKYVQAYLNVEYQTSWGLSTKVCTGSAVFKSATKYNYSKKSHKSGKGTSPAKSPKQNKMSTKGTTKGKSAGKSNGRSNVQGKKGQSDDIVPPSIKSSKGGKGKKNRY